MSASAVLKLQKAGFTTEQVEALADFMDTQAASKTDLLEVKSEVKADIAGVKAELKADIDAAAHQTDMKIAGVKADLAELRSEVRLLEQRMTIKLGSIVFLAVGLLFAAIRYLPAPHP